MFGEMKFRSKKDPDCIVEVLSFNYDGKGTVLYHYTDSLSVEELSLSELQDRILGKKNGEEATYEIIDI